MINIAINGFGRIGKNFLRALLEDKEALEKINIVALNIAKADLESIAFSLKYDTLLGAFKGDVYYKDKKLILDNFSIDILTEIDPENINWLKYSIDWVVDCTGKFTKREQALKHIKSGAKKVLISAPAIDPDVTIVPGVNSDLFNKDKDNIVSLASCTTNALAPIVKILNDEYKIDTAFMTTVHAYTNSQALLDVDPLNKDRRKRRAANLNIIPTTTGSSKVIDYLFPELKGKIKANALRVPVAKVSLIDFTALIKFNNLNSQDINSLFKDKSLNLMKNILEYSDLPLVSCDYYKNSSSVIIDGLLTQVNKNMVKIFGWYDNEWGYSNRLKDFILRYKK